MHKVVKLSQYALAAILLTVILQLLLTMHYSTYLLIFSIWISYSLTILMLGSFAIVFLSWFKVNRNIIVLLYTLSTLSLAVNAALSLSLSTLVLVGQPMESEQMIGSESAFIPYDLSPLNNAFYAASVLSFILTWTATVLILRQHFRKLGRVKYWVMVSIPLVYFLTQFQTFFVFLLFSLGFAASISFVIIYTIIFSASKPIGGILFATAFWAMASSINNDQLKAYMIISAFGLALIFGSDQASILTNRPYPPFGLATVFFLG